MDTIAKNTCDVYIKSQLATHTGFGIRADLGEEVFINAAFMKKFDLRIDTVRKLVLAPNPSRPNTPWQAIGMSMDDAGALVGELVMQASEDDARPIELGIVDAGEEPTARVHIAKLEDRIVEMFDIESNQFASTASTLAVEMDVSEGEMQLALSRMHNAGEIAKAQVFAKGTQEKASFVLWARETTWFSL